MFIDFLPVISSFENELWKERQTDGIARAKVNGVYKGRKPTIDNAMVKQLNETGLGASAVIKQMGLNKRSYYRALEMV